MHNPLEFPLIKMQTRLPFGQCQIPMEESTNQTKICSLNFINPNYIFYHRRLKLICYVSIYYINSFTTFYDISVRYIPPYVQGILYLSKELLLPAYGCGLKSPCCLLTASKFMAVPSSGTPFTCHHMLRGYLTACP